MMSQTAVVLGLALGVPNVVDVSLAQDEKIYEIVETQNVNISGIDDLTIRVSQAPSLIVSEAQHRFDQIRVESSKDELKIRATNKSWFSRRDYSAVLTMPDVSRLSLSGSSKGHVTGVNVDRFTLKIAGSVDLHISGRCKTLNVDAAGSVDLNASDLICADVSVDAAGATDILVHASNALDVDAAGANDILYSGNPAQMSTDVSGAGSVGPAPIKQSDVQRGL